MDEKKKLTMATGHFLHIQINAEEDRGWPLVRSSSIGTTELKENSKIGELEYEDTYLAFPDKDDIVLIMSTDIAKGFIDALRDKVEECERLMGMTVEPKKTLKVKGGFKDENK